MSHIRRTTLKSGRTAYVARYLDPTGKERSKSFPRRKDATNYLARMDQSILTEEYISPSNQKATLTILLVEAADYAHRDTTKRLKLAAAKNLGRLGEIPIGRVQHEHITEWIQECRKGRSWAGGKPLAETSIKMFYAQIKAAFNNEVRKGNLLKSPCVGVIANPQGVTRKVTRGGLLTPAQIVSIGEHASPTVRTMLTVQAATGLRPAELCGLRVRSVNLERHEMHVTEQADRTGRPWSFLPLKTEQSIRTLPLPSTAVTALSSHLYRAARDGDEPLFLSRIGNMFTSTTYGEAFRNARIGAGVMDVFTPHDVRHFYASLLIAHGLDVRTVQHRLGHASPNETLNTYTHLWSDDPARTIDAVDLVFQGE